MIILLMYLHKAENQICFSIIQAAADFYEEKDEDDYFVPRKVFLFSFVHFNVSRVCKLLFIVVVLSNLFCFVCMFLLKVY